MVTVHQTVTTLRADYARNPHAEPRITLAVWRLGQLGHGRPGPRGFLLRRVHDVLDQIWTRGVIGAELPRSVPAGPGLKLPHSGRGVVVHPTSRFGAGVTLYHQVTIGVRGAGSPPVIGDDVYLGCGARILGPIMLGKGCAIGANAVVLKDVPAGEVWVGVPARPVLRADVPPDRRGLNRERS